MEKELLDLYDQLDLANKEELTIEVLVNYFAPTKTGTSRAYKVLQPIPKIQEQMGETCKITALSIVFNYLNAKYPEACPAINMRKKKGLGLFYDPNKKSMRKIVKELGSQIGEIYSARTLTEVATKLGYNNNEILTAKNADDYCQMVINAIDAGIAPICFFDVDDYGDVTQLNSKREHASVIIGYFYNDNHELYFIETFWSDYIAHPAKQFAESAAQLATHREPETFVKHDGMWSNAANYPALVATHPIRKANPNPPSDEGMRNKIVLIKQPLLENELNLDNAFKNLALK